MGMSTLTLAWLLAAAPLPADTMPVNARNFGIPIHIDQGRQSEIRELILFVSPDQGKSWQQNAVAGPEQAQFNFAAPADGIYWFTIAIVDQKGVRTPSDPTLGKPGLKILVDTVKPDIRLRAERNNEDVIVNWDIQDDYAKVSTLKLEYRTTDSAAGAWSPVSIPQETSGQVKFRPAGLGAVSLRMEVQDEAGNIGSAASEVGAAPTPISSLSTAAPPLSASPRDGSWSPTNTVLQPVGVVRDASTPPGAAAVTAAQHDPASSTGSWGNVQPSANNGVVQVLASTSQRVEAPSAPPPAAPANLFPSRGPLPALQFINSNRVTLDYEVAKFGASGVGSVDLYVTRDEGRTWQRMGGEQNPTIPMPADTRGTGTVRRSITAELPGEGVYGFFLVVRSGVGLGKPPPQNGEPPQIRVEVDATPPQATLYRLEPATGTKEALVINWDAKDRNLTTNPITLEWAERRDGRWESIGGADLPNTGHYVWKVPANVPPKVFLRLTVRDTAGNVGVAETQEAITVDLNEPEARFVGIGASPAR
jgi:hypothetical protein